MKYLTTLKGIHYRVTMIYTKFIIWDNLRAHKTPFVTNIIEDRESENKFESVDRPPYAPKLAPMEYVFC